ncbi:response regulator transcription factor [Acetobacterium bakii]|uniref:response regulator transcription factor n=1 Tax=Acetobacterium bakii TaxID=52689 RepID=UPI000E0FE6AC|nr:response regulator transcription factor [Acetobacterium bakii]
MNDQGIKKILVADDSPDILELINILLSAEGYEIVSAQNGQEAVDFTDETIDLIILDVMMPIKSGFKACVEIREKSTVPILFLTAKTQDSDKVMGFSVGGDDYLAKPFSYVELVSRVKSMLRRFYVYQGSGIITSPSQLTLRDLNLNLDTRTLTRNQRVINLTDIEYQILELLLSHLKKIFSTENLYESIWREPYFYQASNTIMVHIRNLRQKIEENPREPQYVKTAWGKGYYID